MTVEKPENELEPKENTSANVTEAEGSSSDVSSPPKSTRETILEAIAETKRKAEEAKKPPQPKSEAAASGGKEPEIKAQPEKAGKPGGTLPPEADKPKEDLDLDRKTKTDDAADGEQDGKTTSKPPASWSRSSKALWESLPPSVQDEVLRREAHAAEGVEKLKERHRTELEAHHARTSDLETAVAPYKEAIRQAGTTDGQVIDRMFKWHMALAGPHKAEAFMALARNFGVDVSTLAGGSGSSEASEGTTRTQDLSWLPAFEGVNQRIAQFEAMTAAQQQSSAQKTVESWSKDKPHFDRVRQRMAHLIAMDAQLLQQGQPAINGFIKNGDQIDMDAAYEAAIFTDPELRAEILRERQEESAAAARQAAEKAAEQAKLDAEFRLRAERSRIEAEKAKRAASSLRPGAPISGLNGAAQQKTSMRNESVRESIRRALQGE